MASLRPRTRLALTSHYDGRRRDEEAAAATAQRSTSPPRSLRRFLLTRMLMWILPLLAFEMGMHWEIERRLLEEVFESELTERARVVASVLSLGAGKLDNEFALEFMPEYSTESGDYYFQAWHSSGESLDRSRSLNGHSLPNQVGTLKDPIAFEAIGPEGIPVRCIGVRFPAHPGMDQALDPKWVDVVVAARSEILVHVLWEGLWEVFWVGLLSTAGIGLAVFLALRQGILLIDRVVDTVESIDPLHLDRRIALETVPQELQPIVRALNRSLQLTSDVLEQERRFNGNVAHELRTPISELRTTTDVALRYPEAIDPHEALLEASQVAKKMGKTVEALLRLSRLQSHETDEEPEPFDLVPLIHEGFLTSDVPGHDFERVHLDLIHRCELPVGASSWALVINNLAENAYEYSPTNSKIAVTLGESEGVVQLTVSNEAPHLTEEDLEHLSARLWRGRSESTGSIHSGLGLSIVAAACKRIGARLDFELSKGELHASVSLASVAEE